MPTHYGTNNKLSLRVTDFSDRELLAIARDFQYSDGEIDIEQVARRIWPSTNRDPDKLWHARHCVAIRFAHMRRLGVLEKIPGQHGKWELTSLGEDVVRNRLKAVKSMMQTADLYEEVTDDEANIMRREFQFRMHRRRWS